MIENRRTRESLNKLLNLARNDADILRTDLADIDRARSTTETSLAELDHSVRREEQKPGADPAQLAAYLDGARARRHNLRTTLMTLEQSESDLRERITLAMSEIKKLEHLIELQDKSRSKSRERRERQNHDDMSAQRVYRG